MNEHFRNVDLTKLFSFCLNIIAADAVMAYAGNRTKPLEKIKLKKFADEMRREFRF